MGVADDRAGFGCCVEQVERPTNHIKVPIDIVWRTKWPAHREVGHESARSHQLLGSMAERFDHDGCRCYPRFFERPCNVSDRHVADRSDGHQEHVVDVLGRDSFYPPVELTLEPSLGSCSRERE